MARKTFDISEQIHTQITHAGCNNIVVIWKTNKFLFNIRKEKICRYKLFQINIE